MNRFRAGSIGLGAILLWSPVLHAQDKADEGSTATVIVRIDDRKSHELTQPWVSLTYADGTMVDALALDNGLDSEDGIGGDHLYVCRLEVPPGENVEVWILDSGPLNSGELIHETRITLLEGRTQRVTLRPDGPSPGSATTVSQDSTITESSDGPPQDGSGEEPQEGPPEEPEIPEIDPSLGFAYEATVTPMRPTIRRWNSRDVWGLVGLAILGLLSIRVSRKTSQRLIDQVNVLTQTINRLEGGRSTRPRPNQSTLPSDQTDSTNRPSNETRNT